MDKRRRAGRGGGSGGRGGRWRGGGGRGRTWYHLPPLLLLLRSPAFSLGFTTLGEIFAYVTVFNPTIEVITLCLCVPGITDHWTLNQMGFDPWSYNFISSSPHVSLPVYAPRKGKIVGLEPIFTSVATIGRHFQARKRRTFPCASQCERTKTVPTSLSEIRGRYHGSRRPSSDDNFHSPAVIPPSALDKPSIMKRYHCRQTTR